MSDAHLRELERRWRLSGAPDDLLRWREARLRAGVVPRERIELAAWLGDPTALATVGGAASADPPWNADPRWNAWARALTPGAARAFLLYAREELLARLGPPVSQRLLGEAGVQDEEVRRHMEVWLAARAEQLAEEVERERRQRQRLLRELGHPAEDVDLALDDAPAIEAAFAAALDAGPVPDREGTARLVRQLESTQRVGGLFSRAALDMARAADRLLRGAQTPPSAAASAAERGDTVMALREAASGAHPAAREALLAWARGDPEP